MWQPEPDWLAVPGGSSPSTLGVWRTASNGIPLVVKRLAVPPESAAADLLSPRHFAYWRREADVAVSGLVGATVGLRGPVMAAEEDPDGITLTSEWVEDASSSGLFLAIALGRFAANDLGTAPWLARDQLRDRLSRVERNGGWRTLARTTLADIAATLWAKRERYLEALELLPQVAQHGDPTPGNLRGRDGDEVVAVDWGSLGRGPVGADLGLLALTTREELSPLIDAYLLGLPPGLATREQVEAAAEVTAVYTAFCRAEWALARVASGEGALAAKYTHPAVAPHLRSLQRQSEAVEHLLGR